MNALSRKDPQLEPHVSLLLDEACKGPFRPGSRITGTVTLQSPVPRRLARAEATFFGHAETHCTRTGSAGTNAFPLGRPNFSTNETLKYHDDACLFQLTQKLAQTIDIEPHRPYKWTVDFTFPHTATLKGASPYLGPTEFSGLYASDRQLLPPSFERYFNSNHHAKVEYTVQAVFQFADAPNALAIQLPPLDFLPMARQPDSSTFVEYVRPPENLPTSISRDKKFFKRSSQDKTTLSPPIFSVVMKASLNSLVSKASSFQVHTCVEVYPQPLDSDKLPSIKLRVTSLKLREVTIFRARLYSGGRAADEYQETGEQTFVLKAVPDNIVAEARPPPSGNHNIFFAGTFEVRIPEAAQPSFRTFNINHSYYLKATVEAEVSGKKLEHKFLVDTLTVHP